MSSGHKEAQKAQNQRNPFVLLALFGGWKDFCGE
jgi:hypothetical protein